MRHWQRYAPWQQRVLVELRAAIITACVIAILGIIQALCMT